MSQYLLSVHTTQGVAHRVPKSPEEMEKFMGTVMALEAEMKANGTFVLTGRLTEPDASKVVRRNEDELVTTDGPYSEAKEHIGGFYIINAADLDEALSWAEKVVDAIRAPIEVRAFVDMPSR